jgi:hypothetical protein
MPRRKDKFKTALKIEKEEENEKVNSILNSLSNIKEIKKEIEKAKKLGYKEPKDYKPMSTDLAQEYMIALVKDKKEKNPSSNIAVTQGVSFDSLIYSDPGSLEHSAILLANTYISIIKQFKNNGGIYTVVTSRSDKDRNVNHQNWFFLDLTNKQLLRFDPSPEYLEFKFNEFINIILQKLKEETGETFEYNNTAGNTVICSFGSCRAFSTMLAVMHIKNINFDNLKNLYDKQQLNTNISMPFIYLLDKYLNDFKIKCTDTFLNPSRGRSKTQLNYLITE